MMIFFFYYVEPYPLVGRYDRRVFQAYFLLQADWHLNLPLSKWLNEGIKLAYPRRVSLSTFDNFQHLRLCNRAVPIQVIQSKGPFEFVVKGAPDVCQIWNLTLFLFVNYLDVTDSAMMNSSNSIVPSLFSSKTSKTNRANKLGSPWGKNCL